MGIMFVYSVSSIKSFENIRNWIRSVEQQAPENISKILVGHNCRSDDERVCRPLGATVTSESAC